jgi:hypothetical protein
MARPFKNLPPYGPVQGTIAGLNLLQRANVTRIDEEVLAREGVAPGNEYKVVGALRFLGLIDESGAVTEKAVVLRSRGSAFQLGLQEILKSAYAPLFTDRGPLTGFDEIHNRLVRHYRMGKESAAKAARLFLALARYAGLVEEGGEAPPGRRADARGSRPAGAGRGVVGEQMGITRRRLPAGGVNVTVTVSILVDSNLVQLPPDELEARLGRIFQAIGNAAVSLQNVRG